MTDAAASLPTWAVYLVAFGTPALAFVGAGLGHLVVWRSGRDTQRRLDREEAGRNLRWAAEQAVSEDATTQLMGLAALEELAGSPLLGKEERDLIAAVTEAVTGETIKAVEAGEAVATPADEEGS